MPDISRVTRSHTQARASYDRLSRWYDFIEGGWESRFRQRGLKLLAIKPGDKLLEIGCGTGNTLLGVPNEVRSIGVDLSFMMLDRARSRLNFAGRSCSFVQTDALSLPFHSEYFDCIYMAFTLELMDTSEIPAVLTEVRRVLRPEGRIGVVALSKLGGTSFIKRIYEWSHAQFPSIVDCRPIYARRSMEGAGFTIIDYFVRSQSGLGIEVVTGKIEKNLA